jgi:hypothetical protein
MMAKHPSQQNQQRQHSQEPQDPEQMSRQELEEQQAADLPGREAMSLLDVNADLNLALDLAAPIDAAVAANANVAAPIDASVSANILSVGSQSLASADQDSIVMQNLEGEATATAIQDADIDQSGD